MSSIRTRPPYAPHGRFASPTSPLPGDHFTTNKCPLGRIIGFLIEHYAGNFPLWLAPDQVRVITLNDDEALINYAKPIVAELR